MDDSVKQKVTPRISEENWLRHFQSLHSNDLFNPDQQNVVNELRRQQDAITPLRLSNHRTRNTNSSYKIEKQQISVFRQNKKTK